MWVYKGESLNNRLGLDRNLGYWLDYWLFLHADDTYPVFRARPLGFHIVAESALKARSGQDISIRKVLAHEAANLSKLQHVLNYLPSPPTSLPLNGKKKEWGDDWLRWFESITRLDADYVTKDIAEALANSLATGDKFTASYLTRKLSTVAAGFNRTRAELFYHIKNEFCDSGKFSGAAFNKERFVENVSSILISDRKEIFTVTIQLTPVYITKNAAYHFRNEKILITTEAEEDQLLLTGVEFDIPAENPNNASSIARVNAASLIERLRTNYYITTHFTGSIFVKSKRTSDETYISFPRPFWVKHTAKRKVPRIPKLFHNLIKALPPDQRPRWNAAKWHMSQALADWSEDTHIAATHVWQAIESFSQINKGYPIQRVGKLLPDYLQQANLEMSEILSLTVGLQRSAILSNGLECDWYYKNTKTDVRKWMRRVMDYRSTTNHQKWNMPDSPDILFDEDVGLLRICDDVINNNKSLPWMSRRLYSDMRLLYAVRNKTVHDGEKFLSEPMASYLAGVGIEVLLTLMNAYAEKIRVHKSKGIYYADELLG